MHPPGRQIFAGKSDSTLQHLRPCHTLLSSILSFLCSETDKFVFLVFTINTAISKAVLETCRGADPVAAISKERNSFYFELNFA